VSGSAAWRALRLGLLALALLVTGSGSAWSHELESASLALVEVAPGRFSVRFHASSEALLDQLDTPAVFPPPCQVHGAQLDCGAKGLVGTIAFPWLEGALTRVMVEVEWQDGKRLLRVASPSSPSVTVYGVPASAGFRSLEPIGSDFVRLGVRHILTGFDHLLFVVALTLLVRGRSALLATVTAFTLAHSLTLSSTALGWVNVPVAPVEASIALSVVLVCAECLRPSDSLMRRAPWLLAFVFGLLHGLGFASALLETGLPEEHVLLSLLSFNLGVELGQIGVVVVALALARVVSRTRLDRSSLRTAMIYAMGATSAFWFIERVPAIFGGW
jgi:hydrogenase/urease accessory protein HupE